MLLHGVWLEGTTAEAVCGLLHVARVGRWTVCLDYGMLWCDWMMHVVPSAWRMVCGAML